MTHSQMKSMKYHGFLVKHIAVCLENEVTAYFDWHSTFYYLHVSVNN